MISIVIPNLNGGGAERQAIYLANEWCSLGYQVELVLMGQPGDLADLVSPSVSIHILEKSRLRYLIFSLRHYFCTRKPNLVLAFFWPLTSISLIAWFIAGRPGKICFVDQTTLSISCREELKLHPLIMKYLVRISYPFADGLVAVSQGVKSDLCNISGLSPDRIKVINNSVVRGLVEPNPLSLTQRDSLWGSEYSYRILAVGSFKPQKNFELLLHSFSLLSDTLNAKLTILGDGPLRTELEETVRRLALGQRVSMPGFFLDTSPWFRSADLFVLSSSWEGLPLVLLEALECGLPIVSTDCPSGPSEILCDGFFGRLVPVGDVNALSLAIKSHLMANHDRDALRRRSQDFTVSSIANQYLRYFHSFGAEL